VEKGRRGDQTYDSLGEAGNIPIIIMEKLFSATLVQYSQYLEDGVELELEVWDLRGLRSIVCERSAEVANPRQSTLCRISGTPVIIFQVSPMRVILVFG
jgi:hypothetical protein